MTRNIDTDDYSTPEALLSDPEPFKRDMYLLGLILYYMLTGTLAKYAYNVRQNNY